MSDILICPKCKAINSTTAKVCINCKTPIDIQAIYDRLSKLFKGDKR